MKNELNNAYFTDSKSIIVLDVVDYIWSGKSDVYYLVEYRGRIYRKYRGYWTAVFDGVCAGYGSVESGFSTHLNKVWDKDFKNKKITKECKININ